MRMFGRAALVIALLFPATGAAARTPPMSASTTPRSIATKPSLSSSTATASYWASRVR